LFVILELKKTGFRLPGKLPINQDRSPRTTGQSRQIVPGDVARAKRRGPGVRRLEAAEFVPTKRRLKDTKQFVFNSLFSIFSAMSFRFTEFGDLRHAPPGSVNQRTL
jgi:hypothetical protein